VRPINSELPFEPEVALGTRPHVRRDDRYEQGAGLDLFADHGIPGIATLRDLIIGG
jgi:hypothetical protein